MATNETLNKSPSQTLVETGSSVPTYERLVHPTLSEIYVFQSKPETAKAAAGFIMDVVQYNPRAVVTYATGATMEPVYAYIEAAVQDGTVDFRQTTGFHLDQYHPIGNNNPSSFTRYLDERVFQPFGIEPHNTYKLNGEAVDPHDEARRYNNLLRQYRVNLTILGIDPSDKHIAFVAPGRPFSTGVHFTELTQATAARDKGRGQDSPPGALTQGTGNILQLDVPASEHKIVLIAYGLDKGAAVAQSLWGSLTPEVPASALQLVPEKLTVLLDKEAGQGVAEWLNGRTQPSSLSLN